MNEVVHFITTKGPLVKSLGHAAPFRTFQAGWLGIGLAANGPTPAYVTYNRYLDLDAHSQIAPGHFLLAFADTIWWDLSSGTVAVLQVIWP